MVRLTDNRKEDYGLFEDMEEAFTFIQKYLKAINYKSHYWRHVPLAEGLMIDYGSHRHTFLITTGKEEENDESPL